MRQRHVTAILLSVMIAISTCIPFGTVNIQAYAAEDDAAVFESAGEDIIVEENTNGSADGQGEEIAPIDLDEPSGIDEGDSFLSETTGNTGTENAVTEKTETDNIATEEITAEETANEDREIAEDTIITEETQDEVIFERLPSWAFQPDELNESETVSIPIQVQFGQTEARRMLDNINDFRTGQNTWIWNQDNTKKVTITGLEELTYDYSLERIAMQRAAELALSYSHTRPDGSDVFSLMTSFDLEAGGENIAAGQETSEEVFTGWAEENEPYEGQGHRRNMLNSAFTHIGIGHVYFDGVHYWTQVFSDCSMEDDADDIPIDDPEEGGWTAQDNSVPNDGTGTVWIETAIERIDIRLETEEEEVYVPIDAWADLPAVKVYLKVQDAWPDRYYQVPFDEFYIEYFSWIDDGSGEYELSQGWDYPIEGEERYAYQICSGELGQITVSASFLGKTVTISVNTAKRLENEGELVLLDAVLPYDGNEKRARVSVLYDGSELEEGTDFTLSYEDNIELGTARVIVQGKGEYTGTLSDIFLIQNIDEVTVSGRFGDFNTITEELGDPDPSMYVTWAIDKNGTLYIFGSGAIPESDLEENEFGMSTIATGLYPWSEYHDVIRKIIVASGIKGKIDNGAFIELDHCSEAVLPEGITEIGWGAFYGCGRLKKVNIPETVSQINVVAFRKCSSLENVTLPDSLQYLMNGAFSECTELRDIELPNSLKLIGEEAFSRCTGLTKIEIPESVEKIGMYAFEECSELQSINIPDTVQYLGPGAFHNCTSLKSVRLPDELTDIYDYTFWGCGSLSQVTLPSKLETIEIGAFRGCRSLKEISLPTTLKKIGALPTQYSWQAIGDLSGAFEECDQLAKVTIPDSVTFINDGTFRKCGSLRSATLPKALTYLGKMAFCSSGLTSITIPDSLTTIENETFWGCTSLKNVNLHNKITTIGEQAFYFCPLLEKLAVPSSVTQIGKLAFSECPDLTLQVVKGSYALEYAKNNKIPYTTGSTVNLAASTKVTLTNVASGIKIAWNEVAGAKYYKVYRGSKYLFTTSRPYGTDTGVKLSNGVKYTYKVVASTTKNDSSGDSTKYRTATGYRLIPVGIKTLSNSAAGKMTVTYDKNAKSSGYVVRFGLKSDMSDAKVITVKGANTVSSTFGGLKKGKTYYVQVRTYKLENGVRYYSGYCTTKTVKINK